MQQRSQNSDRQRTITLMCVGACIGWLAASAPPMPQVTADVRKPPPAVAFKSGGEVSADILRKISGQLDTMDQRLARIETAVAGQAKK